MKYLLSFQGQRSPFQDAAECRLEDTRTALETAMRNGTVDCCYTRAGGGGLMVINAPDHASLMNMIRGRFQGDVEVTPVVDTREFLGARIDAQAEEQEPEWVRNYMREAR